MTAGAQQALRRTMEIYSNTTRFALACNQSNKVIEPIQSRCAMLRYARLTDKELLKRLLEICKEENVQYNDEGLKALIFTSEGDMRQAIGNLQSTWSGFAFVGAEQVYKVCDQPHPAKVRKILMDCTKGDIATAMGGLEELVVAGYSPVDIVTTLFRVTKNHESMAEYTKLEFIKVRARCISSREHFPHTCCRTQEIGFTHMRILEGVGTPVQLAGLLARLCRQNMKPALFTVNGSVI